MGPIKLQNGVSNINYSEFILLLPSRNTSTIKSVITGISIAISPNSDYMNAEILIYYCGTVFKRCGMLLNLSEESLHIPIDNFPIFGKMSFSVKVSGVNCPYVMLSSQPVNNDYRICPINTSHDSSTNIIIGAEYFNKWCKLEYDSIWECDFIKIAIRKTDIINFEKLKLLIKHLSTNLDDYSEYEVSITKRDLVEHKNFYTCDLKISEKIYPEETTIEYALITSSTGDDLSSCDVRFYFPSNGTSAFIGENVRRNMTTTEDKCINLVITKGLPQPIDAAVANMQLFG
jgi:hypothetical protein